MVVVMVMVMVMARSGTTGRYRAPHPIPTESGSTTAVREPGSCPLSEEYTKERFVDGRPPVVEGVVVGLTDGSRNGVVNDVPIQLPPLFQVIVNGSCSRPPLFRPGLTAV
jgi:hypothetical protein